MNDSTVYWMWIQHAVGAGSSAVPKLLEAFSAPEEVYEADRITLQRAGVSGKALECLCRKTLDPIKRMMQRCEQLGWIITPEDVGYPDLLRHIYSPPLVLYGKGLLPQLDATSVPSIGMVGTRKSTSYGEKAAGGIAAGLAAAGCVVISGGAVGIDRASHEGALYGGGRTVAVQACGLDVNYPIPCCEVRERIVEQGGAVITEYEPGVVAYSNHFHVRNRLISGLSWGVCVVEAPEKSGALITARLAREQGRDVFVVPGNITSLQSYGSNELIKDGAMLVTRPSEILADYQSRCGNVLLTEEADRAREAFFAYREQGLPMIQKKTVQHVASPKPIIPCPDTATEKAKRVYAALTQHPITAEELCTVTQMAVSDLFAALTELELFGCAQSYPGKRYSK